MPVGIRGAGAGTGIALGSRVARPRSNQEHVVPTVDPQKPPDPSSAPLPPLQSPLPRSDVLDREEPEFVDEPDLPAPPPPPRKGPPESAAGEEDPGAALDAP
ncbi:hypothetical protein [Rhizobacter sp. Root404]|uniref:hypothetical protein n=1 Tax=Rhizobacter sp. Root404 TaxID=1736528 RepID=UPI000A76C1E4|nr:hypothetical protein [Rhizobacter sp. Root404]